MKREYPDQPMVGVGAVIVRDGTVLLIQRGREPGRGHWAMPGGRLRLGETLAQAARREAQEETGVEIEPDEPLSVTDLIQRDEEGHVRYHYVLVDLLARYVSGEPRANSDALDVRWMGIGEMDAYPISVHARRVLEMGLARAAEKFQ
ncbi:MAG: NUDIX hydrolase [Chloroflexota bacterium]|nr:NUDIX hydrolase [Chloroflexota bacterium]